MLNQSLMKKLKIEPIFPLADFEGNMDASLQICMSEEKIRSQNRPFFHLEDPGYPT